METIDLLRNSELFNNLQETELKIIADLTKTRTVPKNTFIVSEGDTSDLMYFIKEGQVNVMVQDNKCNEFILANLKRGDFFGEVSLLDDNPRSADIVTLEKSVFAVLHKNDIQQLIENNHTFVKNIIKYLCNRIRFVSSIAQSLALMDVYGRLVKLLYDRAIQNESGKLVIEPMLTKQTIASQIGCRRESVSRIFKELYTGKYLIREKNRIIINRKLPPAW